MQGFRSNGNSRAVTHEPLSHRLRVKDITVMYSGVNAAFYAFWLKINYDVHLAYWQSLHRRQHVALFFVVLTIIMFDHTQLIITENNYILCSVNIRLALLKSI